MAAVSNGIKNNAFSYLLLIYANQVLGLPAYLAALALAIAMLWDAVSDLLLGHWSDKTDSRLGRRHPFMYAALFLLPLSFYGLFNPFVTLDEGNTFYYVLVLSILIRTGTTLFEVPSTALLPDLETEYDRRNKWLALRYAFGWTGGNGIHTLNLFLWIGAYGFTVQTGYSIYGLAGALTIAFVIIVSSLGTQRVAASLPKPVEKFRFSEIARELRQIFQSVKNRNFAALFFFGLSRGVASGLGAALYLYNTIYFFAFSGIQIAMTGVGVLVAPIIGYLLAPWVGRTFGKKRGAMIAILANISLYPIPYILLLLGWWPEVGSWVSLYCYTIFILVEVSCIIIGDVLMDSMMADVVEDSELTTERRSEGLFYAARGFAVKAVSAGGIITAGSIVTLIGLDGISSVEQMTEALRFSLALFFLPLYCGLYLLSVYILSIYQITREDHIANLSALAERQTQQQEGQRQEG